MRQKMIKYKKTNNENGVALLFALGLLSLMSVLGVAFVANALTAQKTAVNINSRNQAKLLLDSAVNRLLISSMAVMYQQQSASALSNIYSTPDGFPRPGTNNKGDATPKYDSTQDLLNDPTSGMRLVVPGHPVVKMSNSKASWVYVRNAENQVVGRMAYQVLAQDTGQSSMSLNKVLLGMYNHDDYPAKNNTDPKNLKYADSHLGDPGSTTVRSSWNSRIGRDITELNISGIKSSSSDQSMPDAPFKNEWKYGTSGIYQNLFPANIFSKDLDYSMQNPFSVASTFETFFSGSMFKKIAAWDGGTEDERNAYRDKQEIWFRRWFTDTKDSSAEVYYRLPNEKSTIEKATALHRFNLGKINGAPEDPWYSRFSRYKLSVNKDTFKNNSNKTEESSTNIKTYGVLDELMADSADFLPSDTEVPSTVTSGLPYLKSMIYHTSNIAGSFSGVEFFRKQIAANLNDYCDTDSIPTSDVPAGEWAGDSTIKTPYFTGNEKTPYINEFALGLKLNNFASSATTFSFDITPQLLTELIDIYGGAANTYNLKAWLKNLTFEIEVSASGTLVFENESAPGNFTNVAAARVEPENATEEALTSETSELANKASSNSSEKEFDKGYLVLKNLFTSNKKTRQFTLPTADAIKATLSGNDQKKNISSVTFTSFKITVKKITFNLTALGLYSTAGDNSGKGVDFVRGPADAIESTGDSVSIEIEQSTKKPVSPPNPLPDNWDTFYLSGLEVRDPRQNLNFNKILTNQSGANFVSDKTDWKSVPVLQNILTAADKIGSIEIQNGVYSGLVNTCSNPKEPFTSSDPFSSSGQGTSGKTYDSEGTVITNPAWLGKAKNQHLSTAFIRNAPMKSLWELGAIHRAAAWQTINLKGCSFNGNRYGLHNAKDSAVNNASGFSYEDGDAAILDQVKLTPKAYSSGKLNVNMFLTDHSDNDIKEWDKNIIKALFYNLALGQQLSELDDANKVDDNDIDYNPPTSNLVAWDEIDNNVIVAIKKKPTDAWPIYNNSFASRADFVEGADDQDFEASNRKILANGFGIIDYSTWKNLPDIEQEEIIGKTANLLIATPISTVVYAMVIVQTIKPVNAPVHAVINRPTYKNDGTLLNDTDLEQMEISEENKKEFKIKYFTDKDVNNNKDRHRYVYFDEITGELRALVTLKILNNPKRLQLYNIQYY